MEGNVYRINLKFGGFERKYYSEQNIEDFRKIVMKRRSAAIKNNEPTYFYDEIIRAIAAGDYELITQEEKRAETHKKSSK